MYSSDIKEELSISFLSILCANAGISFDVQRNDDDSTDVIIKKLLTLHDGRKFQSLLRVRLKSTSSDTQYHEDDQYVIYSLKVKNYNDLRLDSTTPIVLMLLILPDNEEEWVNWSQEELVIKGRMYWESFENTEETANQHTINIQISKSHIVNSDTLLELLNKAATDL